MDSELLLKKSSTKLVDNNKIHRISLLEEPTSDPYNIVSKVKEHFGCKNKVDQESKKHGISLYLARCFE